MTTYISANRGVPVDLIPAGSSATGRYTGVAIPSSFRQHKITIKTSAGVVSGAIQPETADNPSYAGTWNPLGGGAITVPAASSEVEYNFEGIFGAIAADITTIIGSGTVQVIYTGS